jgi:hypothetical protein
MQRLARCLFCPITKCHLSHSPSCGLSLQHIREVHRRNHRRQRRFFPDCRMTNVPIKRFGSSRLFPRTYSASLSSTMDTVTSHVGMRLVSDFILVKVILRPTRASSRRRRSRGTCSRSDRPKVEKSRRDLAFRLLRGAARAPRRQVENQARQS